MASQLYTLDDLTGVITLGSTSVTSVQYDDPRVISGPGRDEHWLDTSEMPRLRSAWQELRAAHRRGSPSVEQIRLYVHCASRGIDGHVLV